MGDAEDWALVERARDGDVQAFAVLVRRYQGPIVHFCQRMCGSLPDAEELAQEAFVRLYRHLGRLTPQARFSTVLFGIARNLTLNHLRDTARRGRGRTEPLEGQQVASASAGPDAAARAAELAEMVSAGVARLTAEHREILLLRDVHGMDYEEIAGVLQCQKGTVKSRLSRAREQLRLVLLEMGAFS